MAALYESEGGDVRLDVRLENGTVWLTQQQMSLLYGKATSTVNEHIGDIFSDEELSPEACRKKFGNSEFQQKAPFCYNLDMILAVGFRVRSRNGVLFRKWAGERLKEMGGGGYWKELLNRFRDIRASKKGFCRQVLDIYATSVDYAPKSPISIDFFKKVQNKIHYAVHGQTAAERKAERHEFMTMADWADHLDNVLTMNGEQLLIGPGSVSHEQAMGKATEEYKKYQQRTLSEVEKAYLDTIKMLEDKSKSHPR